MKKISLILIICTISCTHSTIATLKPAGIVRLSSEFDNEKPLAHVNHGGWVFHNGQIFGSSDNQWLTKTDLIGFSRVDLFAIDSPLSVPVKIENQMIYATTESGKIYSFSLKEKKIVWSTSVPHQIAKNIVSTPTHIIVQTAANQIFKLSKKNGEQTWSTQEDFPEDLIVRGSSSPAIFNQTIVSSTSQGSIHFYSLEKGEKLKTIEDTTSKKFKEVIGNIGILSDRVIIAKNYGLIRAISSDDFRNIWTFKTGVITSSVVKDSFVYVSTLNGDLISIQTKDGLVAWRQNTGQAVNSIYIDNQYIYCGGTKGRISAFDKFSGKPLGSHDIEGSVSSTPFEHDGKVYFQTGYSNLYAFTLN